MYNDLKASIKKMINIFVGILWWMLIGLVNTVFAADQFIEANVEPYVVVSTYERSVEMGSVQAGDLTGSFSFYIESNASTLSLQAVVTALYKNANPNNHEVAPIAVNRSRGVDIEPQDAVPLHGRNLNAKYISTANLNKPEGVYLGYKTEQVDLKSTQRNNVFSQDITLHATWTQKEANKPAGKYGGYIVLYVMAPL